MRPKNTLTIIFFFFVSVLYSQNIDIDILRQINVNRNASFDTFFIYLTDSAPVLVYIIMIGILVFAYSRKNKEAQQKAYLIIASFILTAIISNTLKYSLDMPRPFETYAFIEKISVGGSPSFPSGHTSDAFVIAMAVSLAFRKWFIVLPFFIWASLVGYSRMHLGVHYPSDVLAGAIIGSGSAWLCFFLSRKHFGKRMFFQNR